MSAAAFSRSAFFISCLSTAILIKKLLHTLQHITPLAHKPEALKPFQLSLVGNLKNRPVNPTDAGVSKNRPAKPVVVKLNLAL